MVGPEENLQVPQRPALRQRSSSSISSSKGGKSPTKNVDIILDEGHESASCDDEDVQTGEGSKYLMSSSRSKEKIFLCKLS